MSASTATYPLCEGTDESKLWTSLPEDFEFVDADNCLMVQKFIGCNGRRDPAGQSISAGWYLRTGKPDELQTPVEFHVTIESKFGPGYSSKDDVKLYEGKLQRHLFDKKKPKVIGGDGKEIPIPREPGYTLSAALNDNRHLTNFCNVVSHVTKVKYSEHSATLNKTGKFLPWAVVESSGVSEFASLPEKKENWERYGKSFKFKIDPDLTEFYEGTVTDPKTGEVYDIPSSLEKTWNRAGKFEIYGRFHKMNLETKVGTNTVLLATIIKFSPAAPKLGKGANHRKPLPKDFVFPTGAAAAVGTSIPPAYVAPTVNAPPPDVEEPSTPAVAEPGTPTPSTPAPVSPSKDDDVLGVNKRAFSGQD